MIVNYRTISILNCTAKIFEKVVFALIIERVGHYISKNQHKFYKKGSNVSNFSEFTEYIYKILNNGVGVDAVYTNFAKAFDKFSHNILLNKLCMFDLNNTYLVVQIIPCWSSTHSTCKLERINQNIFTQVQMFRKDQRLDIFSLICSLTILSTNSNVKHYCMQTISKYFMVFVS